MTPMHGRANAWFHAALAELTATTLVTSRGRKAREILHVVTRLPDARQRVLTVPWRRWNPFWAVAEQVWILAGSRDAAWITAYNSRLRDYLDSVDAEAFHGAYGDRLRHGPRDQLRDVQRQLQDDPGSRRAVATIHDPARDNPEVPTNDRPCNCALAYHLREGALWAATFNRSNDFVLGLTGINLVQFTAIQEFLAASLGAAPGPYTHFSASLHLYDDDPIAFRLLSHADEAYTFDVYAHVEPTPMRPWQYPEEGWTTITKLYNGLALDAEACPYWRSAGAMLAAWAVLKRGELAEAMAHLATMAAEDWLIAALEYVHRWAWNRKRLAEFDAAYETIHPRWDARRARYLTDYIVHDVADLESQP